MDEETFKVFFQKFVDCCSLSPQAAGALLGRILEILSAIRRNQGPPES